MYKQVETAKTAKLNNGYEIMPLATLVSDSGGVAHIWIDDHCYQLGLESSAEAKSNGEMVCESYVVPVTHIFAEAFDVLRGLPSLSKTNKGFAYSKALAFESLDLREKFDYEKQVFNDVTFDDIEKYAKIIAYKVASNLNNGFVMDKDEDPLDYGK
jgi:hypothetical protein